MPGELQSIREGTVGLDVALLTALSISLLRPIDSERASAIARPALLTLALQSMHFTEEFLTRFPVRFPKLLGLAVWSDDFFVIFNAAWIAIWALGIAYTSYMPRTTGTVLWFLAIAGIANGIAHPAMSLAAAGYFPGLFTAIPLGLSAVWLARSLARASSGKQ